jgi:hypothetical protein
MVGAPVGAGSLWLVVFFAGFALLRCCFTGLEGFSYNIPLTKIYKMATGMIYFTRKAQAFAHINMGAPLFSSVKALLVPQIQARKITVKKPPRGKRMLEAVKSISSKKSRFPGPQPSPRLPG